MRGRLALMAASLVLWMSAGAVADDHLVSREAATARLQAAAAARQGDLAAVQAWLARPEAVSAAASLGADARGLRSGLGTLSDAELSELAARARALEADPAAGLSRDVDQLLVIFLIVAIVILVLQAID